MDQVISMVSAICLLGAKERGHTGHTKSGIPFVRTGVMLTQVHAACRQMLADTFILSKELLEGVLLDDPLGGRIGRRPVKDQLTNLRW